MKLLLLEENQLKLLDYIPRPTISEKKAEIEENSDTFQSMWMQFFEKDLSRAEKAKLAKKAYYDLINKSSPSPIDIKLKNLIQENFKFLALKTTKRAVTSALLNPAAPAHIDAQL